MLIHLIVGNCYCAKTPTDIRELEKCRGGREYKYILIGNDDSLKLYYRIYITETEYETCSVEDFKLFFRVLSEVFV